MKPSRILLSLDQGCPLIIFLFYSLEGASIIPNSSRTFPRRFPLVHYFPKSHMTCVCIGGYFHLRAMEFLKLATTHGMLHTQGIFLTWRINGFIKLGIQLFVCFFSKMIDSDLAGLWTICFLCLPCNANHTQSSFLDLSRFPALIPFSSYSHSLSLKLIAGTLKLFGIIIGKTLHLLYLFAGSLNCFR